MRSEKSESTWKAKANSINLRYYSFNIGIMLYISLPMLLFPLRLFPQSINSIYSPGDWVTYLNTRTITSISEGNLHVYFGTTNGLIQYDMIRREWADPINKSNGLNSDFIYTVAVDRPNGTVWLSTPAGLSHFGEHSRVIYNISMSQLNLFQRERISSIRFSSNSTWLKTTSGYVELDRISGFFKRKHFHPPVEIKWSDFTSKIDNNDIMYFMSNGFEYHNDLNSAIIIDNYLREYDVTTTLTDELGNQYSGTCGSGPFIGNTNLQTLENYNYGLLNNYVTSIAVDDDYQMWIGGIKTFRNENTYSFLGFNNCHEGSGIVKWDMQENEWTYYESISNIGVDIENIRAIEIGDSNIWFATGNGLIYLEMATNEWKRITAFDGLRDDEIESIAIFESSIWVGTNFGIQTVDIITKKVSAPNVFNDLRLSIFDIRNDSADLWIGTSSGAYKIKGTDNKIYHYSSSGEMIAPKSSGGGNVRAFAFSDEFVFLSDDIGISQINKSNDEYKQLPLNPFVFKGNIRRMVVLDDYLWVGTSLGLLRYDVINSSWRKYSIADGLANNSVNDLFIDDDYIWIGTDNGLTQFYWNDPDRSDN